MLATLEKTHRVVQRWLADKGDIKKRLDEIHEAFPDQPIEYAIIEAHGTPSSIMMHEERNEFYDTPKAEDFESMAPDGRIFLISCDTGSPQGIAQKIHEASGRRVFAPSGKPQQWPLTQSAKGKYMPAFFCLNGGTSTTCVFPPTQEKATFDRQNLSLAQSIEFTPEDAYQMGLLVLRAVLLGENPPDRYRAFKFFKYAAERGHARAQYEMGRYYLGSNNYPGAVYEKNDEKAVEYFRLAADQGHEPALIKLVDLCIEDRVQNPQNLRAQIAPLLALASVEGSSSAQAALAYFIAQGWWQGDEGTLLDQARSTEDPYAHHIAELLAKQEKKKRAQERFQEIVEDQDNVFGEHLSDEDYPLLTPDQQKEYKEILFQRGIRHLHLPPPVSELAGDWIVEAAVRGHAEAQFLHAEKRRKESKFEEAYKFYCKAGANKHAEACFQLGLIYAQGCPGVDRSPKRARDAFSKALAYGCTKAKAEMEKLGILVP